MCPEGTQVHSVRNDRSARGAAASSECHGEDLANTSKASGSKGAKESSPPSTTPPVAGTPSGGSGYAIGAALFAVAIAALLYTRCSGDEESAPTPPPVTTAPPTATQEADLPEFAPPPPPEEEEDAGAEDAGKQVSSGGKKPAGNGTGSGGPCGGCGKGVSSGALNSAVSSTAGLARGCYQRALRTGGAEGSLMVSVSVGPAGNLCGARITSDSVGNPAISQCVLAKFQSRSYPKPQSGCVVINVPISFKMKNP